MEITTVADALNGKVYASKDLLADLASKGLAKDAKIINLAYTEYGGDFLDNFYLAYFKEHHPENVIWENTSYDGENGFIFGDIVLQLIDKMADNILGFEDMESVYIIIGYI